MLRWTVCTVLSAWVFVVCTDSRGEEPRPLFQTVAYRAPAGGTGLGGILARGHIADLLPADTQAYFRLSNVQRVRQNFVQAAHVADGVALQAEFEKLLDVAFLSAGESDGLFQSSSETMRAVFDSAEAIHLAVVPSRTGYDFDGPGGNPPEFSDRPGPVLVVELNSMRAIDDHLEKMAEQAGSRIIDGVKVYTLSLREWMVTPEAFCKLDDRTVIYAMTDTALERVLATRRALLAETLAQTSAFRDAYSRFGMEGDYFHFLSFDAIREHSEYSPTALSTWAMRLDADGEQVMRVTAGTDKEYPEFLVGGAKAKKFLDRIPAEAVFVVDGTFKDGNGMREKLLQWMHGELTARDGLLREFSHEFQAAAEHLSLAGGKLDPATVVNFDDGPGILLLALPVGSEAAMFVAPDADGKWGGTVFCDIDDQTQAELIVSKFRELLTGAKITLEWKTESIGGATIHYVDTAPLIWRPGDVPDGLAQAIDFRVGYALNSELLLVGTVGAMKQALQPSGPTYADQINWSGVDRQNTMLLSFKAGSLAHRQIGFAPVDEVLRRIATVIPRDANYTVTFNADQNEAVFRTNFPTSSIVAWLLVEFASEAGGPARLKELEDNFAP